MTTHFDVSADLLIPALADAMEGIDAISTPDWADYVKTGVTRERPPTQANWWFIRSAALLRKVARNGPVGVTALSQMYGGRKDNGSMPNTPATGSRHIIRTSLQQLQDAGLVELVPSKEVESEDGKVQLYSGRVITAAGQKLLDQVAHNVREQANEAYPGLDKY